MSIVQQNPVTVNFCVPKYDVHHAQFYCALLQSSGSQALVPDCRRSTLIEAQDGK